MQYINLRGSLTRNVDSRTTPVKRRLADFLANPLNIWESREQTLFSSEYYSGDINGICSIPVSSQESLRVLRRMGDCGLTTYYSLQNFSHPISGKVKGQFLASWRTVCKASSVMNIWGYVCMVSQTLLHGLGIHKQLDVPRFGAWDLVLGA